MTPKTGHWFSQKIMPNRRGESAPDALPLRRLAPGARAVAVGAADDAVVAGFAAAVCREIALCGQPALQKLAYRRRAARHPLPETEVVEDRQLFRRKHDLQPLTASLVIAHWYAPVPKVRTQKNKITQLEFLTQSRAFYQRDRGS